MRLQYEYQRSVLIRLLNGSLTGQLLDQELQVNANLQLFSSLLGEEDSYLIYENLNALQILNDLENLNNINVLDIINKNSKALEIISKSSIALQILQDNFSSWYTSIVNNIHFPNNSSSGNGSVTISSYKNTLLKELLGGIKTANSLETDLSDSNKLAEFKNLISSDEALALFEDTYTMVNVFYQTFTTGDYIRNIIFDSKKACELISNSYKALKNITFDMVSWIQPMLENNNFIESFYKNKFFVLNQLVNTGNSTNFLPYCKLRKRDFTEVLDTTINIANVVSGKGFLIGGGGSGGQNHVPIPTTTDPYPFGGGGGGQIVSFSFDSSWSGQDLQILLGTGGSVDTAVNSSNTTDGGNTVIKKSNVIEKTAFGGTKGYKGTAEQGEGGGSTTRALNNKIGIEAYDYKDMDFKDICWNTYDFSQCGGRGAIYPDVFGFLATGFYGQQQRDYTQIVRQAGKKYGSGGASGDSTTLENGRKGVGYGVGGGASNRNLSGKAGQGGIGACFLYWIGTEEQDIIAPLAG
jgi:hypothetical protein